MKEAIIIGWVNHKHPAVCGETMKNQLMINKLEENGIKCLVMDFYKWRSHPWVLVKLLYALLFHRNASLIFCTSTQNVYPMMKVMKTVSWKQHTIHWVIGGSLGDKVQNGTFDSKVIGYMNWTLVESNIMVEQLTKAGVKNVIQVPNFKPIPYMPQVEKRHNKLRFVFLSRIMPEKGCDYIIECANTLNKKGLTDKYEIDFYGEVAESYENVFNSKLTTLANVNYKGFLNLRESKGYDTLSTYDMMLFPTYWKGEGFAGIFIDAFISGVPIIASEWAHNRQFLKEGKTALFVPIHNTTALADMMEECINGQYNVSEMAIECQKEAEKYDVNNVITQMLLSKIEIL